MPQLSFGDIEYINRRRKPKRELFLEQMDKIIPWSDWVNMIAAYYPSGKRERYFRQSCHAFVPKDQLSRTTGTGRNNTAAFPIPSGRTHT